jgi:hypothetical protein
MSASIETSNEGRADRHDARFFCVERDPKIDVDPRRRRTTSMWRPIMRGFITTKDVLRHPVLIVRGFGLRVFARCLVHIALGRGRATFLECISSR